MQQADIAGILRDLFVVVLKLGAPCLLTAMAVGLVISMLQAATQINESTLAFVPKLLSIGAVLMLTGSFMYQSLADYTIGLFDQLVVIGGR